MRIGSLLSAWGRLRQGSASQASNGSRTFALKLGFLSATPVLETSFGEMAFIGQRFP
ncbi:MAG TPA: hypothetical protein VGL99_21895 [Chloroflexota bacterium]|jgi:hypothetical protein